MTNAELMAFIKKNPISVGCGAVALVLGAVIYFRGAAIPDAEAELAQKSADAQRHSANLRNADDLQEQVDAMAAANKEVESRLVRAGQLGLNQQYFYLLERETGVKLLEFRPGGLTSNAKGPKTAFNPVQFTVAVNGTLAQVMDFLFRLESGAHYCRVNSTQLFAAAGGRETMTLQLSLELLGLP
jgi:hypothetical protein